jgi:nitrogen fixation protein
MPDIIDINISPVIETVALTIQPNLTTINVNTINGGGGAVDSVNTQTGDVVLDQDDILDGTTYKQYSLTEKNKLAGIAAGAEVNVNADWNATSGDALILNKPTIPSVTNLVPYTGATQNVNLGEFELKAGQLTLDTTPTGTAAVTTTRWNDAIGSSETTLKGGSVILKNGVDLVARVVNKVTPNTTLTKAAYQVVKVSGAQGQRLAVNLAQANTDLNSADTLGIVTETIATNQEGFIITVGQLENINTTGSLQGETWTDGDVLYLSPTTAGRITNIKPNGSTGHIVVLGYVEYAHANNGKIYVKIMNGWELDELHNVFIDTPLNNQVLTYETSTDLWKNKNLNQIVSERRNANNSTDNTINYCGTAPNGSAENSTVWTIKRLTIAASGSITTATATNVAWTNRESATYI